MRDFTEITVILDESYSMYHLKESTLEGLNGFIAEQKNIGDNANLTLVTFSNYHKTILDQVPIKDVKPITGRMYVPNGGTALIDAIGDTIKNAVDRRSWTHARELPDKGMLVIITDGEENASRSYTRQMVFDFIAKAKEQLEWEIVFLAANQDAIGEAANYGIDQNHSINFSYTDVGIDHMYNTVTTGTTAYRTKGSVGDAFSGGDVSDVTQVGTK